MPLALTRRSAVAFAVLTAGIAVVAVPAPRTAFAQAPAAVDPLKRVPTDSATFVHVNVAELWDSKIGENVRAAKLDKPLAEFKQVSGLTPDMLKTVTVFWPKMKVGSDSEAFAVWVTFRKPYDRAAMVKGQIERFKAAKVEVTDKDGVIAFAPTPQTKVRIVANDPMRMEFYTNLDEKSFTREQPPGVISPAIKAAEEGLTAVVGVNIAAMPDELRGEGLPAEARAFQPLFQSDFAFYTAQLAGDELKLVLRFRSAEKGKVAEAEKSLAAGLTFFQAAQAAGVEQLGNSKREQEKRLLPLLKEAGEVLKKVKVSSSDTEATASVSVKADLPIAPVLQVAFGGVPGPGGQAQTQNRLKQIALALHNYHDTYNGFPPATIVDKKGKPMLSWRVMILPYIEQEELYKQFKLDEPWDSEHNKAVFEKNPMPPTFALYGAKPGDKNTHFRVFINNGAIFDPIQPTKLQSITDGTSNTIMVVTAAKSVPWTKPEELEFDPKADPRKLLDATDGGSNVAFADGSVRFVKATIDMDTLKALITKSGGETVANDD